MRWPWVARARLDLAIHNLAEMRASLHVAEREASSWRAIYEQERDRHDRTLERCHELASRQPALAPKAPDPITVEQPDFPPPQVLAAMRRISPVKDKAFDANWAYWERNKEHAAKHPDDFALEILQGVEYDRPSKET